jgi:stage II sporulation protein GA (sporulation sigma-E factor processing peptidase)
MGLNRGGFWSLVLSAGGVCFLCLAGFRGKVRQQQYVPVQIRCGDRHVSLTALVDTGNTLCDPVSGKPVLVVEGGVARQLLQLTAEQVAHPVETLAMARLPGLRLIPYNAVGKTTGLLLGIRADQVEMNGKETECIIAFAPQKLGQGQYQALAGGAL